MAKQNKSLDKWLELLVVKAAILKAIIELLQAVVNLLTEIVKSLQN